MDPVTAFLFATVLMMLNGAVLGVMHRDLAPALREPAFRWRVGTLAIGCLVLALQKWLPPWLALTIGNGLLLAGLICSMAVRRHGCGGSGRSRSREESAGSPSCTTTSRFASCSLRSPG